MGVVNYTFASLKKKKKIHKIHSLLGLGSAVCLRSLKPFHIKPVPQACSLPASRHPAPSLTLLHFLSPESGFEKSLDRSLCSPASQMLSLHTRTIAGTSKLLLLAAVSPLSVPSWAPDGSPSSSTQVTCPLLENSPVVPL